jgi:hypothetical protein
VTARHSRVLDSKASFDIVPVILYQTGIPQPTRLGCRYLRSDTPSKTDRRDSGCLLLDAKTNNPSKTVTAILFLCPSTMLHKGYEGAEVNVHTFLKPLPAVLNE